MNNNSSIDRRSFFIVVTFELSNRTSHRVIPRLTNQPTVSTSGNPRSWPFQRWI